MKIVSDESWTNYFMLNNFVTEICDLIYRGKKISTYLTVFSYVL